MAEATKIKKIDLPDIMLAMDVVDTLRHRQSMVDRELETEAYDQALVAKVRKIYADQGLEVSDEIISRGVAALREDRFTYTPPKWSFKIALARLYVKRGRWAILGAITVSLLLAIWIVYRFAVVGPALREEKQLTNQLTQIWEQFQEAEKTPPLSQLGERLYRQAKADLEAGKTQAVTNTISKLAALARLPDQLAALHAKIKKDAREKTAITTADSLYNDTVAALEREDIQAAQSTLQTLKTLDTRLNEQYTLRIVSRPDTPSGIWRYPQNNPNSRNYYILIEAVAADGKLIARPITNEEDGKTKSVQTWGIRVPERVFNQIKNDKQDNGIIDNNRFGIKRRGYLAPEYQFPTAGGMITQW